jgi:uncharacterized protein (DUF58 family)
MARWRAAFFLDSDFHVTPLDAEHWSGPGRRSAGRAPFSWNGLLWSLLYPTRGQRIVPTMPGLVLISLSMGIGTAAYNSSSNILFITLSLLLACLIFSGVLSWLNLRGMAWRLRVTPPLRAGHDTVVTLELRNAKAFLPTYGLWFECIARPVESGEPPRPESTWLGRGIDFRAALAQSENALLRTRLPLRGRLDAQAETRLEWVLRPGQRGRLRVSLASVGSMFPFGFLRKDIRTELFTDAIVWPAPVAYRRQAAGVARRTAGGERVARAGSGGDLLALRRYASGDSHRMIHWKASARSRQLLVRQFAAEAAEGYSLWLRTDADVWPRPGQFELLVSFVAALAEDLFRLERLTGVAIDAEPPMAVRRVHDLETFLDKLALVQPAPSNSAGEWTVANRRVMTFAPDGARGVAAYVDGEKTATA